MYLKNFRTINKFIRKQNFNKFRISKIKINYNYFKLIIQKLMLLILKIHLKMFSHDGYANNRMTGIIYTELNLVPNKFWHTIIHSLHKDNFM